VQAGAEYVVRLEELAWGAGLLAVTLALHGVGMLGTLRALARTRGRADGAPRLAWELARVVLAAWLILLVHLVEVVVWARFYLWKEALPTPSLAYYVALMNYTTLGSEYDLATGWRLLEGMTGIAGLMTFAWSTGVLVTVANEFQDRQLAAWSRRRARREGSPSSTTAPAAAADELPSREAR
jgi:hypothetical protein